jgi:hypothetical protein
VRHRRRPCGGPCAAWFADGLASALVPAPAARGTQALTYGSRPQARWPGDEETAAVCQVIDLAPAGDGTIVHLKPLPGLVEDYQALVERSLAS